MTANIDVSKVDLRFALDMHYALFMDRDLSDALLPACSELLSNVDYLTYNILLFFACEVLHFIVLRYEDGWHSLINCSDKDVLDDEFIISYMVYPFDDFSRRS